MAQIDGFYIRQRHKVARVIQIGRMGRDFLGRVKPHHAAGHVIVIFEIADDRHIVPKLFEKAQLPPANMADDNIGTKAFFLFDLLRGHDGPKSIACGLFPNG